MKTKNGRTSEIEPMNSSTSMTTTTATTPLEKQLRALPNRPGVYQFKDDHGTVLYVGKAKNLRTRVRSYFRANADLYGNKGELVKRIANIEPIIVNNEIEALILENTLIKKYRPKYNIALKDGQNFVYIEIDHAQTFPTINLVRSRTKRTAHYFGPYTSKWIVTRTLKNIGKLFPYRTCATDLETHRLTTCLDFHIGKCPGPCEGHITKDEYGKRITYIEHFLKGRHRELLENLRVEMSTRAKHEEYERAANIRDTIQAMENVLERQEVALPEHFNLDAIAISFDHPVIANVLRIRNGVVFSQESIELVNVLDEHTTPVLEEFLVRYYAMVTDIPGEILVEDVPSTKDVLERWLTSRRKTSVVITQPKRGRKRHILAMSAENALQQQKSKRPEHTPSALPWPATGRELKKLFALPNIPTTIECFDISNIQGAFAVGSMVVFENAKPSIAKYRRFRMKTFPQGQSDDFGMLAEVMRRRLEHMEPDATHHWPLPDLFLIDGGAPQLRALQPLLASRNVTTPMIGIAKVRKNKGKFEERFIRLHDNVPVTLPKNCNALKLLTQARDEAHRFAIAYYRQQHTKKTGQSKLDEIRGIGPKTKKLLMSTFGSIAEIERTDDTTLATLIGTTKTELLRRHLPRP